MDIRKLGNKAFDKILLLIHYKQAQNLGLDIELPKDLTFNEEELFNLLQYAEIISHDIDDNQRIKAVTIIALLAEIFKNKHIINESFEDVLRKTSTNILINLGLSVTAQMLNEENKHYYSVDNIVNELVLGNKIKESTIRLKDKFFTLSGFQKRVWDGISQYKKIAISAPTSAGKSFALNLKIIDLMLNKDENIITVYIVPTISLINQVCSDLKGFLKELSVDNIKVLQAVSDKFENEKAIYVLTQERALTAINNYDWLKNKLKFLVVDEIQNIEKVSSDSDEERSLILLEALNSIDEEFDLEKEILAGARIKNINEFNKKFLGEESFSISDELPTVINLTYSFSRVKNARNTPIQFAQKVTSLKGAETIIRVNDDFDFTNKIFNKSQYNDYFEKLILTIIKQDPHNIIFASKSNQATNNAKTIQSKLNIEKNTNGLDVYLRKTVHQDYPLALCVQKGIGYHHGKLPAHVRHVVEICFKEGIIDTLFCTTTLMQGVNLPAKNIIVWNPNVGGEKLSGYDYTNLRGRAGRLMHDFIGRAIILDKKAFENENIAINEDVEKNINLSFQKKYRENKVPINEMLLTDTPVNDFTKDANEITIYIRSLFVRIPKDKVYNRISKLGMDIPEKVLSECEKITLGLPDLVKMVSLQLPHMDPLTLNAIYNKVINSEWKTPPNSAYQNDLVNQLLTQFELIFQTTPYYFKKAFKSNNLTSFDDIRKRLLSLSISASSWIKNAPISEVINPVNYPISDPDEIDNRLKAISNVICFEIPKLLKPAFMINDLVNYKKFKNPLLTFLEFGASNPELRALIDYGIPRETAINLINITSPTFLDKETLSFDKLELYLKSSLKNEKVEYWDKRIIERVL